ncbi:putative glucosylceramidase 3 [Megalopta genalis]|uniref:putative glucosylceramidase 3 n=1 Tax=Megalopta genalis TaxID=115081 RepID=UPI003FD684EB
MEVVWKSVLFLGVFLIIGGKSQECVPRSFGNQKIVCVCNATYCDETPERVPKVPKNGSFYWYVSTKGGQRLNFSEKKFGQCDRSLLSLLNTVTLNLDHTKKYQSILGFGGAFTDSSGIHIKSLSNATQEQLLRSYFGKGGSRYSMGRLPIGGTDFSTRVYTYDDVEDDVTLKNFSLAPEDYDYKIPYLQKALELQPDLKLFASAWSPPPWMKTNDKINGFGFLKEEYYSLYVDYLLKFLESYKANDIPVWGMSTGNEPVNAVIPFDRLNTMGWIPESMADWVGNYLGPRLAASKFNDTLILALDDQRIFLPWYIQKLFDNSKAKQYTAGTAVHFYADFLWPASVLTDTHNDFPDKFILMTEACTGAGPFVKHVDLGQWNRGEIYIMSIMDYMNNWSVGWLDWNLVLDETGGPNWFQNNVDAPIIVNATSDEFYKQPMYYALKHFSRFVERGSSRISIDDDILVRATAFVTPSNETVVVLYNRLDFSRKVVIKEANKEDLCLELPPKSMNTIIYGY